MFCQNYITLQTPPHYLFLFVKATEVKMNDVEFNPEFVSRMIPKLEWSVLVQAAEEVSVTPMTLPSGPRYFVCIFCLLVFERC